MKKIFMIIGMIATLFVLMSATIATNSSFLGNKEKGIGVEVTRAGHINIYPKTTVGVTTISNDVTFEDDITFEGDITMTDAVLTLDSTLTLKNGATITNPDSIVITEAGGIKLANNTRVNGTLTSTGAFTATSTSTLSDDITLESSATITNPDSLIFTEAAGIKLANDTFIAGALNGRAATFTGTVTALNGATITNPDSLVLTETGGIKLAGDAFVAGALTGRAATFTGTVTTLNGGTITNPDSLVLTEAAGIKLANGTRITGELNGRDATFTGTTTLAATLDGVLKATSGVVSAATANTDYLATAKYDSLRNFYASGILVDGTLAISGTPEDFKTTTTLIHVFSGIQYTKAAEDNLSFSSAYTINTASGAGDFWGAFLIQSTSAGTISTKAVSADQTYADEATAIANLPDADADNNAIGYITVEANNGADWVANTDDMTAASDCQAANFYDTTVNVFPNIAAP